MGGTFAIRDNIGYVRSQTDTTGYPTLSTTNETTGETSLLVELRNGHDISSYALTNAGVVWLETWYTQPAIDCRQVTPCGPHEYQPVSWALNLTTLDKRTTHLDSGVVSRTSVEGELASPLPPAVAAQGDRVAYAIPRLHVQGAPEASQILVRSLPDGSLIRTIDTDGYASDLGVFGQAITFGNTLDTAGPGSVVAGDFTLYATASDAQNVSALASHVSTDTIGDGGMAGDVRVAYTVGSPDTGGVTVVRLSDLQSTSVRPSKGQSGAFGPVIVGDGVVWIVQVQDSTGAWSSVVDAWHPGWERGRPVPALGSPDSLLGSDGKLLFSGADVPALKTSGAPEGAVSAQDLFGQ